MGDDLYFMYIYDNLSLISSQNEKCSLQNT